MRKRILVLVETPLPRDARVSRQLGFLVAGGHEVECACLAPGAVEGVAWELPAAAAPRGLAAKLAGAALLLLGLHAAYHRRKPFVREMGTRLAGRRYDAIIANDIDMLPLALQLAAGQKCAVVLDAHEYAPEQYGHDLRWQLLFGRYMRWLCSTYLRRADAMFTVGEGIARLYRERWGVEARVLTNAPPYEAELRPSPPEAGRVRLIHHGSINRNRRIELMIRAVEFLPESHSLDLMIVNRESDYYEHLRSIAGPRVHFIPPVSVREVAAGINGHDIGVYLLPPSNPNQELALPNKFFEFVQARLAVVVGPSPEMAGLVERHGLGAVAADYTPEAFARAILSLTPARIQACKENAARAAPELSAGRNGELLLSTLAELLA